MERDDERRESTYEEDALGVPDHGPSTNPWGAVPHDEQMPPAEQPRGSEEWGTTAAEQRAGRPLDDRLAAEVPDRLPHETEDGVRLIDDGDPDDTPELTSSEDGADREDIAAEEAAVHERRDAPGATTAPDSYVIDESPGSAGDGGSEGTQ